MTVSLKAIAQSCLDAAYEGRMTFPDMVGTLIEAGFESYRVDYLSHVATYYHTDGDCVELPTLRDDATVATDFDIPAIQAAIREAQQQIEGYTYKSFCAKMIAAGCASYIVSFTGRRVLYIGRTAETHTEHFPQ